MPLTAATLTLPCHKTQIRPIGSHDGPERMFEAACRGLSITSEQLRNELDANDDIPDLMSGTLMPATLRLIAETLSTMRYVGKDGTPQRLPEIAEGGST